MAAAHEFVEVRLLTDLRTGTVAVVRAAGGGDGPAAGRVRAQHRAPAGPPGQSSSVPQLLDAAYGALDRWRRVESSPLTSREAKIAARGVVRTCEGIVAALVPARV